MKLFIQSYSTYTNSRLSGINVSASLESLRLQEVAKVNKRVNFLVHSQPFQQPFHPMSLSAQLIPHHYLQYCEYIKRDSNPQRQGPHLRDL